MVYVLDCNGRALMPTERSGKVRRLLRDGLAVPVRRTPLTVRLLYTTTDFVQDVTLGVDAGTTRIGLSATTDTKELFSSEVTLRTDIVKLLAQRREARRTRRGHKTRHRAPRFDNRRRPDGWLTPSVEQRVQSHLNVIGKVKDILPVKSVVIETAQFDMQRIKNPDIAGTEYQRGEQTGFWNVREYVLYRDGHRCQACHGRSKDPVLNVHHIESRLTGGDSPSNLVTLCRTCHKAYHRGEIKPDLRRGSQSLRDAAAMNVMRWALYDRARALWGDVRPTYGYITKHTRITNGLEKGKRTDARCISGNPLARPCAEWLQMRQTRRHNRQIHKANLLSGGRRKANQAPYLVKGFRLFDKVRLGNTECFVFGRRTRGNFNIRFIDGTVIHTDIGFRKLRFLEISRRYLLTLEREPIRFPIPTKAGSTLG